MNERIGAPRVNSKFSNVCLINAYVPMVDKEDSVKTSLLDLSQPSNNVRTVLGDSAMMEKVLLYRETITGDSLLYRLISFTTASKISIEHPYVRSCRKANCDSVHYLAKGRYGYRIANNERSRFIPAILRVLERKNGIEIC